MMLAEVPIGMAVGLAALPGTRAGRSATDAGQTRPAITGTGAAGREPVMNSARVCITNRWTIAMPGHLSGELGTGSEIQFCEHVRQMCLHGPA